MSSGADSLQERKDKLQDLIETYSRKVWPSVVVRLVQKATCIWLMLSRRVV